MCGCGRKKTPAVTSAQLAQQEADARGAADAWGELAAQTVSQAEQYARSASNAIGNANSR